MVRWLKSIWYWRSRRADLEILWPACREQAKDIYHARAAFAVHALHDRAWLVLGRRKVERIIDGLR
jgi:hypothetical protein